MKLKKIKVKLKIFLLRFLKLILRIPFYKKPFKEHIGTLCNLKYKHYIKIKIFSRYYLTWKYKIIKPRKLEKFFRWIDDDATYKKF